MFNDSKTAFIIAGICLLLVSVWGGFHGVNAGIFSIINNIIAVLAISLIGVVLVSTILNFKPKFIEDVKGSSLSLIFIIFVLILNTLVLTCIVSYTTGGGVLETIENLFLNPRLYYYQVSINQNLISMYCGTYLLIIFLKYISEKFNANVLDTTSKKAYLFMALLVIMGVVAKIPEFYKYKVLSTAVWSILTYLFVAIVINVLNIKKENNYTQLGFGEISLAVASVLSFSFISSIGALTITSDLFIAVMGLGVGFAAALHLKAYSVEFKKVQKNSLYKVYVSLVLFILSLSCLLQVLGLNIPKALVSTTLLIIPVVFILLIRKGVSIELKSG